MMAVVTIASIPRTALLRDHLRDFKRKIVAGKMKMSGEISESFDGEVSSSKGNLYIVMDPCM